MIRRALVALALVLHGSAIGAPEAKGGQVVRVEHYDPSTTPANGPANALVTVELFFAPSYSGAVRMPAWRHLEALQQRHPTRVRTIYRVVRRGGAGPQLPALALEAYAQGLFFEFIKEIHGQRTNLTRDQMLELAKRVGMDATRAERAIVDDRYGEVLTANERRLERLGGTSSPAMFFNGKPARGSLSSMTENDYELAYHDAYDRARDLLDRGIARKDLMSAFDAETLDGTQPAVVTAGQIDDDSIVETSEHPLATPPLSLAGLPTFGDPDAAAPVPVVVVCRPNDSTCTQLLRIVRNVHNIYRGEIRLVWAPWFRVDRDDAAELTLLGDAVLCAEQIGSNPEDFDASPGWQWITESLTQLARLHGRRMVPDRLIDSVASKLRIDTKQLSACRARLANTTLDWIEAARRSGIIASPALVIGGRIYHGLNDQTAIQQLVEAELAPGVLGRCATTGC